MNVTIVYGTERKGCTYNIAQQVIKNLNSPSVTEIFLPRDLPVFCISCYRCFMEEIGTCTHSEYTRKLRDKLLSADLIILTSPVYSYHLTGQMKSFLDHFANMWLVHRPEESMFKKQGLVISTAAGPVYSNTLKELKDSLDFWGVAKTYKIGTAVFALNWVETSEKVKNKMSIKSKKIAKKIEKNNGKIKPCFRVRKWFYINRLMQKYLKMNSADKKYWQEKGWLNNKRPF